MVLQFQPILSLSFPSLPRFSRSHHLHFIPSSIPSITSAALSRRTPQSDGADDATWHDSDELDFEPRGFGLDMDSYDTSLEEKLLDEIHHNRKKLNVNLDKDKVRKGSVNLDKVKVQKENVNLDKVRGKKESLQNVNSDKVRVKKEISKNKGSRKQTDSTAVTSKIDVTPKGIRVRLCNLPKKKNIHRDLQMAFKGFRGILHLDPAVSGNAKTRDPICKGFAFVDLANQEIANRFVEMYSNRNISFGKIEKQINCCIVNQSSNSAPKFINNSPKAPILQRQLHEGFMGISVKNTPEEEEAQVIFVDEDEIEEKDEGVSSKFEIIEVGDNNDDGEEDDWESEITKIPSVEKKGTKGLKKKSVRPKRKVKAPKLSMPLRLKGKERDVLTGVFSKYGANSGATSTKEA